VCNYWQLSGIPGGEVEHEQFLKDIRGRLEEAKRGSREDRQLEREYEWIEKPLVFFIDYMVKEGRFSFRAEWRELAREYNELSGDEKFFELLESTIKQPDLTSSCMVFYIMLGLGFEGAYRYKREHIERYMQLCIDKAKNSYDTHAEGVLPLPKKRRGVLGGLRLNVRHALICSVIFMIISLIINLIVFNDVTENYRGVLRRTVEDSFPRTLYRPLSGEEE
jgi:type VI protein secretion system component VasF